MTRWDLASVLDEEMFEFQRPEGARQIEFLPSAGSEAQAH
jgi:hypothetical protein